MGPWTEAGRRRMAFVIALLAALTASASCRAEAIRVGSEIDFPPYAVVDARGKPDGFSVDLFNAVATTMGLQATIVPGSWHEVWTGVQSGALDALPLVARSAGREELVDLTVPHTVAYDAFFVRRGSPAITRLAEAQGRDIIVMASDAGHEAIRDAGVARRIITVATIPEAMRLLAKGEHDAVLVPKLLGNLVLRDLGLSNAIASGPPLTEYRREFCFAVRKGNADLRAKLDEGLAIVKATGRYHDIYDAWFGALEPPRLHLEQFLWLGFGVGGVSVLSVAWLVMLRRQVARRTRQLASEIEHRRRVEEDLRHMLEQISRSNVELERFAYLAAHDLQEPLRTQVAFTQLLERRLAGRLDSDSEDFLRLIIAAAHRMHALVNDLLAYVQERDHSEPVEPVPLNRAVERAMHTLLPEIDENRAVFCIGELPTVMAERASLTQVFRHLIGNALKYRRPDRPPRIDITARSSADGVVISVADNGIGIEPAYHEQIFELFRRLHPAHAYPGTGAGLTIARQIVERHGGRIWVESQGAGAGTTFHIAFPAGTAPPSVR